MLSFRFPNILMILFTLLISSGIAIENTRVAHFSQMAEAVDHSPVSTEEKYANVLVKGECNQHDHLLQCQMNTDDCSQTMILFAQDSALLASSQTFPVSSSFSYYYRIPYGNERPPKSMLV